MEKMTGTRQRSRQGVASIHNKLGTIWVIWYLHFPFICNGVTVLLRSDY